MENMNLQKFINFHFEIFIFLYFLLISLLKNQAKNFENRFLVACTQLLPKWSNDLNYGPRPPACDFGSRVSGLVLFLQHDSRWTLQQYGTVICLATKVSEKNGSSKYLFMILWFFFFFYDFVIFFSDFVIFFHGFSLVDILKQVKMTFKRKRKNITALIQCVITFLCTRFYSWVCWSVGPLHRSVNFGLGVCFLSTKIDFDNKISILIFYRSTLKMLTLIGQIRYSKYISV